MIIKRETRRTTAPAIADRLHLRRGRRTPSAPAPTVADGGRSRGRWTSALALTADRPGRQLRQHRWAARTPPGPEPAAERRRSLRHPGPGWVPPHRTPTRWPSGTWRWPGTAWRPRRPSSTPRRGELIRPVGGRGELIG